MEATSLLLLAQRLTLISADQPHAQLLSAGIGLARHRANASGARRELLRVTALGALSIPRIGGGSV